ncbi:MAG TPA: nitroreductase family deazaflavin-dependent oxidoreductase [Alphaproteobacteria bacterium]|nr:nitroreductase family deazaflavin-dependent oxidoreductase [Alphaproteobacteria bacterium]
MADKIDLSKVVSDLDSGKVPVWIQEHLRIYLESGGKQGHMWDASIAGEGLGPTPTLLLTTIGRKSGQKRTMPLIYGKVDGNHIVIGSKGGSETHAAWYLNLLANPVAQVQVATEKFTARARIATGAERAKIWAHMLSVYPPYQDYQNRTSREIPVVVLEKQ